VVAEGGRRGWLATLAISVLFGGMILIVVALRPAMMLLASWRSFLAA
jgi:hypothetical protein